MQRAAEPQRLARRGRRAPAGRHGSRSCPPAHARPPAGSARPSAADNSPAGRRVRPRGAPRRRAQQRSVFHGTTSGSYSTHRTDLRATVKFLHIPTTKGRNHVENSAFPSNIRRRAEKHPDEKLENKSLFVETFPARGSDRRVQQLPRQRQNGGGLQAVFDRHAAPRPAAPAAPRPAGGALSRAPCPRCRPAELERPAPRTRRMAPAAKGKWVQPSTRASGPAAGTPGKPCGKAALQCRTGQFTALDELHQLRTGAFQNMAVLGAALQQGSKFLLAERGLRGQARRCEPPGSRVNGQLERRLDADDDPVRPAGAQRTDGGGCRRVAGHNKGLCAPVKQALGMGKRQRTNFCASGACHRARWPSRRSRENARSASARPAPAGRSVRRHRNQIRQWGPIRPPPFQQLVSYYTPFQPKKQIPGRENAAVRRTSAKLQLDK